MSSRRGGKQPFTGPSNSQPPKGKSTIPYGYSSGTPGGSGTNPRVDQLSHNMTKLGIDSTQDGDWQVYSKNSKNRTSGNAKPWPAQGFTPNAWSHPNVVQKPGLNDNSGIGKPTLVALQAQPAGVHPYRNPTPVAPPLQHGWQWGARAGSSHNATQTFDDEDEDEDDLIEDDDDMSDDFDSDGNVKSHDTLKKHKWLKSFIDELDKLNVAALNEPSRRWHCPACKNGPGAIDWYRGLQALITHAKTKGSKRVKLHRAFAELLDEELIRRGTSGIPAGEAFGKWEGLHEADRQIIWPPMVVIMNTQYEKDEMDETWTGMGSAELQDHFSSYEKVVKARHAYGPKGHRGISILIFESSAVGYYDAERLHNDLASQGLGRESWDKPNKVTRKPGGNRQLYGFMARKDDLEIFNRHCQDRAKLKFEQRSYQEMVVVPIRQMREENQQVIWLKNRVAEEKKHSKALEQSVGVITQKLKKTMEETRIVRERSKLQFNQNKEEMDHQQQFFEDQLSIITQNLEDEERAFEERLQEARNKIKQSTAKEKGKLRQDEIAKLIQAQAEGVKEFEGEREKLIKLHEQKKAEMKCRHMVEEIELEKEFEISLTSLMEQYTPHSSGP